MIGINSVAELLEEKGWSLLPEVSGQGTSTMYAIIGGEGEGQRDYDYRISISPLPGSTTFFEISLIDGQDRLCPNFAVEEAELEEILINPREFLDKLSPAFMED